MKSDDFGKELEDKKYWVCFLYQGELVSQTSYNSELKSSMVLFWFLIFFIMFLKNIQIFKKGIFEKGRV